MVGAAASRDVGINRGKQLVVLVGKKKALAMAVKNHLGRSRYTKLAEWLS
jgi:exodeoxyribonuclease V alpha subunit